MKKTLITILATVLVCACLVGGTLAWLTDKTETVTNTFTVGDINIELDESDNLDLKMVPGTTITKDPVVTVLKDSEACYLFVKLEKSANFDTYMTYTMADGWTALTGQTGVYWRKVDATTADTSFDVILNDTVTVLNTVTKDALEAAKGNQPTLSVTAYAVQSENVADAATAWGYIPTT